jgi:RimJ/RimL family protein N-acetyltransferase
MELSTERLQLRELDESDAAACNAYESDPEVVRWQSHGVRTLAESAAYIRKVRAEQADFPRRLFDLAVVRRDGDELIGRCGLLVDEPETREGTLFYILRRDQWSRGYMTEAARALVGFGFRQLGLHRVYVDCDPRNTASIRVAEKLGMRREAHFVENARLKGEWCDSLIYAILDREWRTG